MQASHLLASRGDFGCLQLAANYDFLMLIGKKARIANGSSDE